MDPRIKLKYAFSDNPANFSPPSMGVRSITLAKNLFIPASFVTKCTFQTSEDRCRGIPPPLSPSGCSNMLAPTPPSVFPAPSSDSPRDSNLAIGAYNWRTVFCCVDVVHIWIRGSIFFASNCKPALCLKYILLLLYYKTQHWPHLKGSWSKLPRLCWLAMMRVVATGKRGTVQIAAYSVTAAPSERFFWQLK